MRVLADSHSIYWYLTSPGRLSELALLALGEAEDSGGVVVSAWSVPELWMASTRKTGVGSITRGSYELVRAALVDPDIAVDVEPFGPAMWPHFESVSTVLADPFDSAIVATALALGVEVVTRDRAITDSGTVGVIWSLRPLQLRFRLRFRRGADRQVSLPKVVLRGDKGTAALGWRSSSDHASRPLMSLWLRPRWIWLRRLNH